MALTDTDKDKVQKLECKVNNLLISGVSQPFNSGDIIDRDTDTNAFDSIYSGSATIAAKGSHTDEDFVVDTERNRTIDPDFWVSPNGDDTNDGTRNKPLASLSKAVGVLKNDFAASADKELTVMAGSLAEDVTVDFENLTLKGKGPTLTDINGLTISSGVGCEVENIKVASLDVQNQDTTVWFENLHVTGDVTIADVTNMSVTGRSFLVDGTVTDAGANLTEFGEDISAL